MAGEVWKRVGDYVSLQRGNTYNGSLVGKPGPALLGLGSIEPGGGFRADHYKTFGGECPAKIMLGPGEIYVALKGATKDGSMVGSVARLPENIPSGRLTQDTARLDFFDQSPEVVNHLYWVLRTPQYRQYCSGRLTGSAAASFSRDDFLSYPVSPITPMSRIIVSLLEAVEMKIELNRRMNETLEAMARALFESWFVDFEPVRAKVEGRDSGLPKHLADLFPDTFEDSEFGPVPCGWQPCKWGDLVSLEYGKALTGYDRKDGAYAVYGTNGRIGSHAEALCPHPGIIVGRKGAYRGVHYCDAPFFVIDTAFYVAPKVPLEMRWVYYELLRLDINSMDSGSAIPSTSRQDFYGLPVLAPPFLVQECFVKSLGPMWHRQTQNELEYQTLIALRDTLLPKLISGELRVKDAERFLKDRLL